MLRKNKVNYSLLREKIIEILKEISKANMYQIYNTLIEKHSYLRNTGLTYGTVKKCVDTMIINDILDTKKTGKGINQYFILEGKKA